MARVGLVGVIQRLGLKHRVTESTEEKTQTSALLANRDHHSKVLFVFPVFSYSYSANGGTRTPTRWKSNPGGVLRDES
jgi:hypothetical protein